MKTSRDIYGKPRRWHTKFNTPTKVQKRRTQHRAMFNNSIASWPAAEDADSDPFDPSIAGRSKISRANPLLGPPPCFFFDKCRAWADRCKQGKSVCAACAAALTGQELPLQDPRAPVPYASVSEALHAFEMDYVKPGGHMNLYANPQH